MRLTSLVRRSVALTATTALVSGGLASGFLAAPVLAAPGDPVITSVSPAAAINAAASTLTISGQNFVPVADSVSFVPLFSGDGVAPISGTVSAPDSTVSSLSVSADFTRVGPGAYRVEVAQSTVGTVTATCECFSVTSQGPATAQGITAGTANGSKATWYPVPLTITGQNIAKGATVSFLKPDGTPDTALAFRAGWTDGAGAGYVSFSSLRGSYTYAQSGQPAFTPGRHLIKLDNTVQPFATPALDFYQPVFDASGVVPNALGQGATNQVVTVTGHGFRAGSKIEIAGAGLSNCASDVTVGTTSFSETATNTILSAPVTITGGTCSAATARTVGVRGPDGGYYSVPGAFTVHAAPTVGSINPSTLGQGGSRSVVVTGTGFSTNPGDEPVFTFADSKVTAETTSVTNATTATITVFAAPDAPVGDIGLTVTNPADHGSTSYNASKALFTIDAGPTVTVPPTPASTGLGTTSPTITVKGLNFDGTNSMVVRLYKEDADGNLVPSLDTHVTDVVVTPAGVLDPAGTPDTLTFRVQVDANATPGLRDLYLENNGDKGAYLCVACFGIDSLALSPNAGSNTGTYTLHVIGQGIKSDGTSSVELLRVNAPQDESPIVGSWVVSTLSDGDPTQADAVFDLKDVAPGAYNAVVQVDPTNTLSCSHCFTVAGQAITVTGVSPNSAGQGATSVPITITGTNFSHGEIVSIPDAIVHDVAFVDSSHLTAFVDILESAATGAKTVTVTNADGAKNATLASGFTINAGPKPTNATNGGNAAVWGQGAGLDGTKQTITVTGPGFITGTSSDPSSTLNLGTGITVLNVVVTQGASSPLNSNPDDTLTADIVVAADAPTGFHNVVVTNPDKGVGTLNGKLEIKPGPKPTSVSPTALRPGQSGESLVITGTGFASDALPLIDGLTLTNPTVNADGTQITVTAAVNSDATIGFRGVGVRNPSNKGYGVCSACFAIANLPSAPRSVTVTPGSQSLFVSWFAPASNGGAPITSYVVRALRSGTTTPVTVQTTSTDATVSGLTNGATYSVQVFAVNAAGPGTPSAAVSGIPGKAVTLTLAASTKTITAGTAMTFSGRLTSGATSLAGRVVTLSFAPGVGAKFTRTVTTTSTGTWSYRFVPLYTFSVGAVYAGDATYRPASSPRVSVGVATLIRRTSPSSSYTTSAASTVLKVAGSVAPNKSGKVIYLYRVVNGTNTLIARTTVTTSSTYAFSIKPGRGTYTFRVFIPATTGNLAAYSPSFVVKRV